MIKVATRSACGDASAPSRPAGGRGEVGPGHAARRPRVDGRIGTVTTIDTGRTCCAAVIGIDGVALSSEHVAAGERRCAR